MQAPVVVFVSPPCASTNAWGRVVDVLENDNVVTRSVQLPSCVPGSTDDDATALRAALDKVGEPVVLVGHSSGGFVITEAGDQPNVRHLVYMDAIMPDAGEPITKFMGRVDSSFASAFRMKGEFVWFDADALTAHLTDRGWLADDAREFAGAFRRQRVSGTVIEPTHVAWRSVPSTLIRASDSEMDRDVQDLCARRAERVVEIGGDHFPNWRRPDEIAGIIKKIVDELST